MGQPGRHAGGNRTGGIAVADHDGAGETWYLKHRDELFVALQRLLPHHGASRLLGKLADSRTPWLKNRLIRLALRHYGVDLKEAELEDYRDYVSFNDFFTRRLKPDARPVDDDPLSLVSPADGTVSQYGHIRDGEILQAKGHHYSVKSLLGGSDPDEWGRFLNGSFFTVYLSPRDYHRVHMPVAGGIGETRYIPGKLFSVNSTTTRKIDRLFSRNERLVCLADTEFGKVAVVLVGALFVAGIETRWRQYYPPGKGDLSRFEPPKRFHKGEELGLFRFGSTVVVLTEQPVEWRPAIAPDASCAMGMSLGRFGTAAGTG